MFLSYTMSFTTVYNWLPALTLPSTSTYPAAAVSTITLRGRDRATPAG